MKKRLFLATDHKRHLIATCESDYPLEACGLLVGVQREGDYHIQRIIGSPNRAQNPAQAFEIDPALILKHQRDCRKDGLMIIGHYHSHPDGPAAPSQRDRAQHYDPHLLWLIISITEGQFQDIKSFASDPACNNNLIPIDLVQSAETA